MLTAAGKGHGGGSDSGASGEGNGVAGDRGEGASLFTVYSSILLEVLSCVCITLLNFLFRKKRLFENKIFKKGNYGSPVKVAWGRRPEG